MKTFWIDRYDHILSREEFTNAELISVYDIRDDKGLQKKFLAEESKLIEFAKKWIVQTEATTIQLIINRQHLHDILPITAEMQTVYDQLSPLSLLELAINDSSLLKLEHLFQLAIREILTITIKANEQVLQTDYDMAFFLQGIASQALDKLVKTTQLHCLSERDEENFWQEAEEWLTKFQFRLSRVKGAMYGMAIGDALGAPAEFLAREEIKARLLPNGFLHSNDAFMKVTDDTQMAIAVALALQDCEDYEPLPLEKSLRKYFVQWLDDPQNNRAPGMTCLASCERLAKGIHWTEATDKSSKGCGANMRVLPIGLLRDQPALLGNLTQFQAAITHAHPTALAASELTALVVYELMNGTLPANLLTNIFAYIEAQQTTYHEDYLQNIWDRPPFRTPEEFIRLGWDECREVLKKVEAGLINPDFGIDPCAIGGEGWTAEESLATALYCFLLLPEDPKQVLQCAICTSGDSDSIACLAGGFVGAYLGIDALPKNWVANIEYKKELEEVIGFL